jgi:2-amino-4-hydroxy-6-hydroxymethyldihydropteridine diphosphokinase
LKEAGDLERKIPREKTHVVYLSLGSNIEPAMNLPKAVEYLQKHVYIDAVSQVWETPPAGTRGPNFLNAAVQLRTQLSPGLLKSLVLRPVEAQMGRVRTWNKYAPRKIDLDIVIFDSKILDTKLWTQAYIAVPIAELLPDLPGPNDHETLLEIAQRLASITSLTLRPDVIL